MTRPREKVHSCLCTTARTGDIDSLIVVSVFVFPLGVISTTAGTVSVCSTPSSVVTVVKLGAEEVTLFWMDSLLVAIEQ